MKGERRSSGDRTRNCRHRRLCKSQSALKGDPHRSVSKFRISPRKVQRSHKRVKRTLNSMPRREPKTFPVPNEETEVIFLRFYAGRSVLEIADKLQVAEIKVKDFWKNFSRNLKIRKSNQKYLNKKKRLDRRHHAFIEEYLNKNLLLVFTLQVFRSVLISEFPELSNHSKPTIGKSLRTQHEISYRKFSRAVPKTLTEDSHRKMMETAAIMSHLEHQMIEVIFIDEFTVSGRSYKPYGWSKISQKGWKKIWDSNFSMGFIIGFSGRCMYGTMGIKGTTTSTIFAFYMSRLLDHIESSRSSEYSRYALWCDNASYHKTEQVHNLLK